MDELTKLQEENRQLKETLSSLGESSKMLIRRDLELRRAYEKMKSLERSKSEFVSIAAHQLRTPLSAIKWSQQMVLDGDLGPVSRDQKEMLKQSQLSVSRMVRLVNNLLDADHLELGIDSFLKKELNFVKVAQAALDELTSIALEKNITLEFVHQHEMVRVQGNGDRLKEVLINLVDNALKYTFEGGVVKITIITEGDRLICTVKDNGIGIPEAYQQKIFDRFTRAENAKRVDADGSGLGLYIVKKIVENHGGSINFVSKEGDGTEFKISLPIINHPS